MHFSAPASVGRKRRRSFFPPVLKKRERNHARQTVLLNYVGDFKPLQLFLPRVYLTNFDGRGVSPGSRQRDVPPAHKQTRYLKKKKKSSMIGGVIFFLTLVI